MSLAFIHFAARVASASGLGVARPLTCLLLIQATMAVTNHLARDTGPVVDHWLASPWVTAFALAGAVYEWLVEHEDDAEELQRALFVDKLWRAAATLATTDLLIAADYPGLIGQAASPEGADVAQAVQLASGVEAPLGMRLGVLAAAVALNLGLTALRGRVLDWLADLGLKGLWQRLETGGVLVALVLLAIFPLLVLAVMIVAALVLAGLALGAKRWEQAADRRRRRPCPHCAELIRREALVCPGCRREVEPTNWLE